MPGGGGAGAYRRRSPARSAPSRRSYLRTERAALTCTTVLALTVSPWLVRSFRPHRISYVRYPNRLLFVAGNNPYTFGYYPYESINHG